MSVDSCNIFRENAETFFGIVDLPIRCNYYFFGFIFCYCVLVVCCHLTHTAAHCAIFSAVISLVLV